MHVITACNEDIPAWLELAREVEDLFGVPLSTDASFLSALRRNVARGSAFCVRAGDGPPGAVLCAGLLFSATHRPLYHFGWLAVAERCRRMGLARQLLRHAESLVLPPAELLVTTFAPEQAGGEAARLLYLSEGFEAAEFVPDENGARRQNFRKRIEG